MADKLSNPKAVSTADGTLCEFCDDLLRVSLPRSQRKVDSRSFKAVQDCRRFCKFCDLLYRKILRDPVIDQQQLGYRFRSDTSTTPDYVPAIEVTYGPRDTRGFKQGHKQFKFIPASDVHNGEFFPGQLDSAKKSGRAQELMNKWLDDCKNKHINCGIVADKDWRPTRLLDIGEGPGFNSLRLCEGDEIRPGVTYMTLSHCWGGSQPIKLTRETNSQFRNSIASTDLPRTFREALEIVRRFGKRYIWIDSICIMQDSNEDWRREADTMCSVYRNSFCNIGATGASDSSQGCFLERTDEVLQISLPREGKSSKRYFGPEVVEFYYFDEEEWEQTFKTAPLNKRAWVVQEKLLAPRMVHLGLSQIAWECKELRTTERFPDSSDRNRLDSTDPKRFTTLKAPKSDFMYLKAFTNAWNDIIATYSRARLTLESDRIPALTGIVDTYKESTSDEFLAGLWRSTVEFGLAWWAEEPGQRYNSYVAPSWSWLSVKDTPIYGGPHIFARPEDKLCHVLHAEVTPSPGKSKYTVMDGHIRCWGRVALAKWSSYGLTGDSKRQLLVWSDTNTTKALDFRFHADTPEAMNATEMLLFPIYFDALWNEVFILVLERNEENPATYRRIGICRTRNEMGIWEACDYFTGILHSNSIDMGLEPALRDYSLVLVGKIDIGRYGMQEGVSITIK